jgi:hypothetical protein
LEKEAVEDAARQSEENKLQQLQAAGQDKALRKQEGQREEQTLQRRRETDEGMYERHA